MKNAEDIVKQIQDEAFKKGWDACAQAIYTAIGVSVPPQTSVDVAAPSQRKIKGTRKKGRRGTTINKVLNFVKTNPGKRGFEIVSGASVEERSARTALHRLKKDGTLINDGGNWFFNDLT